MRDLDISDGGSDDLDLDDIQTPVSHPRTFVTVATVVNPPVAGNAPCTEKNPPPKGKKGKSRAAPKKAAAPVTQGRSQKQVDSTDLDEVLEIDEGGN
jgi:hypothetical protein